MVKPPWNTTAGPKSRTTVYHLSVLDTVISMYMLWLISLAPWIIEVSGCTQLAKRGKSLYEEWEGRGDTWNNYILEDLG